MTELTGPPPPPVATRCWTVVGGPGGTVDVEVRVADTAELGTVLAALGRALGGAVPAAGPALWSGSTPLPADTALTDPVLQHGAVLGWGRPGPRSPAPGGGAVELHVTGGPDTGRTVPLGREPLTVGRGGGCRLVLGDVDVSRRHVRVGIEGSTVTVADLGSSNGSLLTVEPAPGDPGGTLRVGTDGRVWPLGARLRLGSSTVRLSTTVEAPVSTLPAAGGRRLVVPAAAPAGPAHPPVTVPVPAPPSVRDRRRLGWVAVALPAVGGVSMAWLLDAPQFLFFALLSPVVAVGTWASDRWSGRRGARRDTVAHAVALAAAERAVEAAVAAETAARERAAPDTARLVVAVRRRCAPLWGRAGGSAPVVRLGSGPGPTGVRREPAGGSPEEVPGGHLPVVVDLTGGLAVRGPRATALGVARTCLVQLAVLYRPRDVELVLAVSSAAEADWRWARWLPHLVETVRPEALADALERRTAGHSGGPSGGSGVPSGPWTVVVLDGPLDEQAAGRVRALAGERVLCIEVVSGGGPGVPATVSLRVAGETGAAAVLEQPGAPPRPLVLDCLSVPVAASVARGLAPLSSPSVGAATLPDRVRLLDLPAAVPAWDRDRGSLTAVLGSGVAGPVAVDLCAHGPHALVAGTTGAGKSELLQTLVAGLALAHPPDRCSFLLVDYKGGAAFAEAAALPHTVGLLTDLDGASTARALRSLTAELTRRERLLAAHDARDLAGLPDGVPLARLVIVVDEFATLSEELPGFVTGLVGIAQRGRSLGVHLVLATQRPAGVVSAEIRANCTLRLCLRTTDEADSRDVLGSPAAAALPVDRPGRALLRVGAGDLVPLQVARVAVPADERATPGPQVSLRPWPPRPVAPAAGAGGPPGDRPTDLARLVARLQQRARADGAPAPDRPWSPPLPARLEVGDLDPGTAGAIDGLRGPEPRATLLRWGLVDRPEAQDREPLELDLEAGGAWLLVGGPRSGRTTALLTVLGEAVTRVPADRLHVHVLDLGGGTVAAAAADLPHTGTVVGRDDPHRTVRLLARLQQEVDRRRATTAPGPPLLLLVDGVDALSTLLDEVDPGAGSGALLRLLRDGAAAGLTCLLTGDRAVPGGRLAAAAGRRLVLPLPDRADYAVAGVPARLVPGSRPPGRALLGEDAVEVQLALPRPAPWTVQATADRGPADAGAGGRVRVVALPADPRLPAGAVGPPGVVLLGPGGDEGSPVPVDVLRLGGLLVAGPPGSGRSTTLRAVAARLRAGRTPVQELTPTAPGADPDLDALRAWAEGLSAPGVVVVDDVAALPDPTADALAALARPGGPVVVVAGGGAAELAAAFRGPVVALRRSRTVLLLAPARGDAELLAVRLPRTPLPARPGSGWLVLGGTPVRVQVARLPPHVPAAGVATGAGAGAGARAAAGAVDGAAGAPAGDGAPVGNGAPAGDDAPASARGRHRAPATLVPPHGQAAPPSATAAPPTPLPAVA